jgi:hypothetical protein
MGSQCAFRTPKKARSEIVEPARGHVEGHWAEFPDPRRFKDRFDAVDEFGNHQPQAFEGNA